MSTASARTRADGTGRRDEGSVLPLVLVLIILAALIVVPLMKYTMSVMRANSTLSARTGRYEAVKGGLRTALHDPLELYRWCDEQMPKVVRGGSMNALSEMCRTRYRFHEIAGFRAGDLGFRLARGGGPP